MHWPDNLPAWVQPVATIIAAIITFIGGMVATYFGYLVRNRRDRDKDLALLLEDIAHDLDVMGRFFAKKRIPTAAGNHLKEIIRSGSRTLKKALGKETGQFQAKLDEIFTNALRVDDDFRWAVERVYNGKVDVWIKEAERMSAKLRARAAMLRAGK